MDVAQSGGVILSLGSRAIHTAQLSIFNASSLPAPIIMMSQIDPELARRLGMDIQEVSKELVEEEAGDSNIAGNS